MEASYTIDGDTVFFDFKRDENDESNIRDLHFSMTDVRPYVKMSRHDMSKEIHPDLIALSIIMMVNPFVGEILDLKFDVSKRFLDKVSSVISRYQVRCQGHDVTPLEKRGNRPGLAFSGGADSSAALSVLPKDLCLVFLERPMRTNSHYDSSAPLEICHRLIEVGYDVSIIETNLEYLREPVGFPTDLANAIPAILHSEDLELDSIAFGTVLESAYGIGHEHFTDYSEGSHFRFFSTLFESVGLELNLPTIGISEVGTAIIGHGAPGGSLQQSCIRGSLFSPCYTCWKCFRKELLNYALGFTAISPNFQEMMRSKEIQQRLCSFPISHENVITYSLQRIELSEINQLKILSKKLDMRSELSFLEEWYAPSIEFVPRKYRFIVREKIMQYLPAMRLESEELVTNWQMEEHLSSSSAKSGQERLLKLWK